MPQEYDTKLDITIEDINRALGNSMSELMTLDETGQATKDLAAHARGHYFAHAEDRGLDPRTGIDDELIEKAVGDTMGFAQGERPSLNGMPVIPFERGMKQGMMEQIWDSLTEKDFERMNEGGMPICESGKKLSIDDVKEGVLFQKNPGVYQIAYMSDEGLEMVLDNKTGLPYEFDYLEIKDTIEERLMGGEYATVFEQLQYEDDYEV